ncbi:MAG: putative ubiquitin-RnfH superfamily antitoxin RatB of RatAB toxin-antitoxin module [Lysobacterales bacterium]
MQTSILQLSLRKVNMEPESICVEVVYALPEKQVLLALEVPIGTTLGEAIEFSGIKNEFPEMLVDPARLGIFSIKAGLDDVLHAGDRVEIYRPLIADPKEARRKRASEEKPARKSQPGKVSEIKPVSKK